MKELIVSVCVCADTITGNWPFTADQSQTANENEDMKNLLCSHLSSSLY